MSIYPKLSKCIVPIALFVGFDVVLPPWSHHDLLVVGDIHHNEPILTQPMKRYSTIDAVCYSS